MISISVTAFSRNFKKIMDMVQHGGEEVVLVRNQQKIARITPGSPHLTAMEAMADLYRTLPESSARDWEAEGRLAGTLDEMRDPCE